MPITDEKKILGLLYSFSLGYEQEVPMSLYNYVLPLLNFPGDVSAESLGALLRAHIKRDPHFMESFGKAYKANGTLISKALSMAFIHKTMKFDVHDGELYASFVKAYEPIDDDSYALGVLFKGYSEMRFRELLARCASKIVFLQTASLGTDMDLTPFNDFGDISYYDYVSQDEVLDLCQGAQIVITNKNVFDAPMLEALPSLKMIALTATGTNNVDLDYAKQKGIQVCNVAGYSTEPVANLTLSMALSLELKLSSYDQYVKSQQYAESQQFSYFGLPFHNFSSLTWGIIGLGRIGHRVATYATALGAHVIYHSLSGHARVEDYPQVSLDELLSKSDIISLHCPLDDASYHLFNAEAFKKMKKDAILINVARGPIVDEAALAEALNNHEIGAAALDVFEKEPLPVTSPLYSIEDASRIILTPHVGWGSIEARTLLCQEVYQNIAAYMDGMDRNRVV